MSGPYHGYGAPGRGTPECAWGPIPNLGTNIPSLTSLPRRRDFRNDRRGRSHVSLDRLVTVWSGPGGRRTSVSFYLCESVRVYIDPFECPTVFDSPGLVLSGLITSPSSVVPSSGVGFSLLLTVGRSCQELRQTRKVRSLHLRDPLCPPHPLRLTT